MPRKKRTKEPNSNSTTVPCSTAQPVPSPPKTYASVLATSAKKPQSNAEVFREKNTPYDKCTSEAQWARTLSCDRLHRVDSGRTAKCSSITRNANLRRSSSSQLDTNVPVQKVFSKSTRSQQSGMSSYTVKPTHAKTTSVQRRNRTPKKSSNNPHVPCQTPRKNRSTSRQSETSTRSASERRFDEPSLVSWTDLLDCSQSSSSRPDADTTFTSVSQQSRLKPIDENKPEKIGKTREVPKSKRPSRLKRIILSERAVHRCASAPNRTNFQEQESKAELESSSIPHDSQADMDSQITRAVDNSALTEEQERKVCELLQKLSTFQDRAYVKYAHVPFHRRRTKRFVCGLREVMKHLRLKHLSLIVLARNLERCATDRCYQLQRLSSFSDATTISDTMTSPEPGSPPTPALENILQQIWVLATYSDPPTPIIITQTRRKLGSICHKPKPVSIVGILSVAGAEDLAKELLVPSIAINLSQPVHAIPTADEIVTSSPKKSGAPPREVVDPLLSFCPSLLKALQDSVNTTPGSNKVLIESS